MAAQQLFIRVMNEDEPVEIPIEQVSVYPISVLSIPYVYCFVWSFHCFVVAAATVVVVVVVVVVSPTRAHVCFCVGL